MAHTITLSDEEFERLQTVARLYQRSAEQLLSDLLSSLSPAMLPPSDEEYRQRWAAFMSAVGSIQHGAPLTNEQIDELIGEEAAETHATESECADAP